MLKSVVFIMLCVGVQRVIADDFSVKRPDGHAPIHVMGDHVHEKGGWMLSYRAMYMRMNENMAGTDKLTTDDVFGQGYRMAPESMTMMMHMFGAMFASSDTITWTFMLPYIDNNMDMTMKMNRQKMDSETRGLGDIKLGGLFSVWHDDASRLHLNLSLSAPTGDVDKTNDEGNIAPYPMQVGSGTWDVLPGVTFNQQWADYSVGAQFMAVLRTGKNDRGYRLGNQYQLTSWVAKPIYDNLSLSFSFDYKLTQNIHGKDKDLNAMMTPTADPNLRAGQVVLTGVGFNALLPKGNRLAIEYQLPIYQHLEGPQLALAQAITAGWQYSF